MAKLISPGAFVAVLTQPGRDDLGAEFFGTVVEVEGGYVTVAADEPGRGIVRVRDDLVEVVP